MQQKCRRLVQMPLTGFVDPEQHDFVLVPVDSFDDALGGLQRDLMLRRFTTEKNAYTDLTSHCLATLTASVIQTIASYRLG